MGPLLAAFAHPLGLARRVLRSPRAMATWATDLFYYRACGFFDGRQAPDYRKLTPFGTSSQRRTRGLEGLFNPQFNQKLSVS